MGGNIKPQRLAEYVQNAQGSLRWVERKLDN